MRESTIRTERLFAAADLLLAAVNSEDGMKSTVEVATDERHDALTDGLFTQAELVEAMAFLIRLGLAPGSDEPR